MKVSRGTVTWHASQCSMLALRTPFPVTENDIVLCSNSKVAYIKIGLLYGHIHVYVAIEQSYFDISYFVRKQL